MKNVVIPNVFRHIHNVLTLCQGCNNVFKFLLRSIVLSTTAVEGYRLSVHTSRLEANSTHFLVRHIPPTDADADNVCNFDYENVTSTEIFTPLSI